MGFRQQCGVVKGTEFRQLAVAEGEHVQPLDVAGATAAAHGPGIAAEDEDLVAVGVEFLRLEVRDVLGFGQRAKEFPHASAALANSAAAQALAACGEHGREPQNRSRLPDSGRMAKHAQQKDKRLLACAQSRLRPARSFKLDYCRSWLGLETRGRALLAIKDRRPANNGKRPLLTANYARDHYMLTCTHSRQAGPTKSETTTGRHVPPAMPLS